MRVTDRIIARRLNHEKSSSFQPDNIPTAEHPLHYLPADSSINFETSVASDHPVDNYLDVPDHFQAQSHYSHASFLTHIDEGFDTPPDEVNPSRWTSPDEPSTTLHVHSTNQKKEVVNYGAQTNTGPVTEDSAKSTTHNTISGFPEWQSPPRSRDAESPSTTFSSSESPLMSPLTLRQFGDGPASSLTTLDVGKANASVGTIPLRAQAEHGPVSSPSLQEHVQELEHELRGVSTELANSIKREMELEDQLERWKADSVAAATETNRRTSDYYSDSGASSVRYPFNDGDTKLEELERLRRKAEQEKAQLKAEMADKLNDELRQRRSLEAQVEGLEITLQRKSSQQPVSTEDGKQTRQLDDLRRRLNEEREFKENFQDLLAAMREELEQHRNERDKLRDEIVPQLRARVDGLETEASIAQQLSFENARMQRELEQLKEENQVLASSQADSKTSTKSTASVAGKTFGFGFSRSRSPAKSPIIDSKESSESRDTLSDRLKDVEEQRNALHIALRSLLERQEYQAKEHAKRVKALEAERDKYATASPRRTAFHKEVSQLRGEVDHLRRRADEVIDQKFRCEKGLGGLRTDLDRARQETSSLRRLLQEHDISPPKCVDGSDSSEAKNLSGHDEMKGSLQALKQSIMDAEKERDLALKEAENYRRQARTLQKSEMAHLGKEKELASQLEASAQRMDSLAEQVQEQLLSNSKLRQRLADAVTRGEGEQETSADRITTMQSRLRELEDKIMVAQRHSDDVVTKHEEEIRQLKEAHDAQLHRAKAGLLSPTRLNAFPLSPSGLSGSSSTPAGNLFSQRTPRLEAAGTGRAQSIMDESRTLFLQKKVEDLEKALAEADSQMHEVVERMNMAQIEVAELQSDRDEALRKTRNLQSEILAEREKVKAMMT